MTKQEIMSDIQSMVQEIIEALDKAESLSK